MPIHSLDVVVKAGKFVIPEKGHLGFALKLALSI
jgi:hypothetical protein